MLRTRVIPTLLLRDGALVKTVNFDKFEYIGDPANTVRIFNELEVDELVVLDILASKENRKIDFDTLFEIAEEAFMPLAYGGGVSNFEDAKRIFSIGFEKVVINSIAVENNEFISELAHHFGNQSIIGSIDVKKNFFGKYEVLSHSGTKSTGLEPIEYAKKLAEKGVGELLITSIDQEGTWAGFDIELMNNIVKAVSVPVIANGGAGSVNDIENVVKKAKVSAVAVGSMVVFQKKDYGVLVNFPDREQLEERLK
jgi:cyclase